MNLTGIHCHNMQVFWDMTSFDWYGHFGAV